MADSGLARNELFITTKIYARDWGYRRARAAVERSLRYISSSSPIELSQNQHTLYNSCWLVLAECDTFC